MVQVRQARTVAVMPPISDKIRRSAYRSTMKRPLPDWWPAAQIVAAVVLVVGFFIAALVQFGNNDAGVQPVASDVAYTAEVISNPDSEPATQPQDSVAPSDQTIAETTPETSMPDTATPTVPGSSTDEVSYKVLPTTIDSQNASVELVEGGTKAVPIGAWIAVRDYVVATYGGSQVTGAALRSGSGVAYTFVVSLTGSAAAYNVQVVAVQQANGAWGAN